MKINSSVDLETGKNHFISATLELGEGPEGELFSSTDDLTVYFQSNMAADLKNLKRNFDMYANLVNVFGDYISWSLAEEIETAKKGLAAITEIQARYASKIKAKEAADLAMAFAANLNQVKLTEATNVPNLSDESLHQGKTKEEYMLEVAPERVKKIQDLKAKNKGISRVIVFNDSEDDSIIDATASIAQ